jgi:hypothetical protein
MTSQQAHEAARTACAEEVVVHYGPRSGGTGCQLGGQDLLWRILGPKRQLEKTQLGERQA